MSGMDPARLLLGAHQAYNACVHGCLFKRSVPEPEALEACAAILARIEALCMDAVRVRREAPQAKRALALAPELNQAIQVGSMAVGV